MATREEARAHFEEHGWTVMRGLVSEEDARSIREALLHHTMDEQWFHVAQMAGVAGTVYTQDVPKNYPTVVGNRAAAGARGGNILHYSFTRTQSEGTPVMRHLLEFLKSERLGAVIEDITGMKCTLETMFASKYVTGDFLDVHTDGVKGRRKLAFVFNLSVDWRAEYGGVLMMGDKPIVPEFNSLVLFDVRNGGRAHHVTAVTDKTNATRLAVSGWFEGD